MSLSVQDNICELVASSSTGAQYRPQRGSAGVGQWILRNEEPCCGAAPLLSIEQGAKRGAWALGQTGALLRRTGSAAGVQVAGIS